MDLCVGLRFSVGMMSVYLKLAINCKRLFSGDSVVSLLSFSIERGWKPRLPLEGCETHVVLDRARLETAPTQRRL